MTVDPAPQNILDRFHDHLVATGESAHTIDACGSDVRLVGGWFSIVRRACGWTILAENWWPHDGRKLTEGPRPVWFATNDPTRPWVELRVIADVRQSAGVSRTGSPPDDWTWWTNPRRR